MLFNKNVKFGDKIKDLDLVYAESFVGAEDWCVDLRHLPQFYRSDIDYVYRRGGLVMRKFIDALPLSKHFQYVSIDSRIHMLKPGMMPCIGGWHCDDFYRPTGTQPDLQAIITDDKHSIHHAMVVGNVAMTEFITESFEMPVPSEEELKGQNLYAHFSAKLNAMPLEKTKAKSGQIITFDSFDFHRGVVAEASGWRLFVRATESNHYVPVNEIRTQTQVYLSSFDAGW